MNDYDAVIPLFIQESRQLLEDMERLLLHLEQDEDPMESLNAIFRVAHTIKGSAGIFGFEVIVGFTHGVEELLDKLREDIQLLSSELTSLLLSCGDHISDLIDHLDQGGELSESVILIGQELSKEINRYQLIFKGDKSLPQALDNNCDPKMTSSNITKVLAQDDKSRLERLDNQVVESDNWHISLRFGLDSFRDGMDPISFLIYLSTLGQIQSIVTLDSLPHADDMDAETCYLGFEISFHSDANRQEISDVFQFIRESSQVKILAPSSYISDYIELINGLPEEDLLLGEILIRCGSITQGELQESLSLQESMTADGKSKPLGDIVVETGFTTGKVLETAIEKQNKVRESQVRVSQSVRVDATKLDELINLVGELVISGAGVALSANNSGDTSLIESINVLSTLVDDVRDSTLRLRMVQVGDTFNRFQRVVRDVSKESGKEIDLRITGVETELDKTVVEKIADPLMHLVRNAIDHGIELPSQRLAKGKSSTGTLSLDAYNDSGSVVIEVKDDGAGLDREQIMKKAIDKGLATEGQFLEDKELFDLIFQPGFSTAAAVTNLSGRGVGMDVVKRNITGLRGTVELESQLGEGTTCRIRIPLTLAIIDGFLVEVAGSSFVLQLDSVMECVELNDETCEISSGKDYINLRDEVLPIINLRKQFLLSGESPKRENVVVVRSEGIQFGILVDVLNGEFQTVIKPLGTIFEHIEGISGSTIMGNGEVALILDGAGLLREIMLKGRSKNNELSKKMSVELTN